MCNKKISRCDKVVGPHELTTAVVICNIGGINFPGRSVAYEFPFFPGG